MKKHLILLMRQNCHLCWAMEKTLKEKLSHLNCQMLDIDLPENKLWFEQYNLLVPVLLLNGKEVCHYHLDEKTIALLKND